MSNRYLDELRKGDLVKLTFDKNEYEVLFIRALYILLKNTRKQKYALINIKENILYFNNPEFKNLYDEIEFIMYINYLNDGRNDLGQTKKYDADMVISVE